MLISSAAKLAMVKMNHISEEPPLDDLLKLYFIDVDIVLTEGFKKNTLPKIEVHRKERSPSLLCRGEEYDETLIALASDEKIDVDVPIFDINDFVGICDFIEIKYLSL
jgi:molybdopterin-guanine dinucleotide biosynthesis protein MobB